MKALVISLFIFGALPSFAAYENPEEAFELNDDEKDPSGEDIQLRRKEKYQWDESLVYQLNSDLGIRDQRRYTGLDRNRLSIGLHVNGQYEYPQDLLGVEVTWLRRLDNWSKLWVGGTFRHHKTQWEVITQNRSTGAEAALRRPSDVKQDITSVGLGAGYRFKLFLDFLRTQDVFEQVQAYATYNILNETFSGSRYQGPGLTAEYSLHKRTRTSFFYGGKFGYNLAWVEFDDERDLSLGWYTFALETGFHF